MGTILWCVPGLIGARVAQRLLWINTQHRLHQSRTSLSSHTIAVYYFSKKYARKVIEFDGRELRVRCRVAEFPKHRLARTPHSKLTHPQSGPSDKYKTALGRCTH